MNGGNSPFIKKKKEREEKIVQRVDQMGRELEPLRLQGNPQHVTGPGEGSC